jgi:hypothetical protein
MPQTAIDTQQSLKDYDRDGVVRIRGLLAPDEVREIRENIARYVREHLASLHPAEYVLEKDGKTVRNLWRMLEHDEYFRKWTQRPELLELIAPFVKGEPVCVQAETFNKPARVGSGVPPHQDNAYFCQSPPDMLTLWIAIDAATVENGPIYYVPGSHRELLPHRTSMVQGNSIGLADPIATPKSEHFRGTLEPGDALIHHCQTIHYSDPNTTDHPRCGFLLVYRGSHTKTEPKLMERYTMARATVEPT